MRYAQYKTETELCAAFIPWAREQGWTAYAETAGWDIVLVDATGAQIGVQAKMRFNMKVLAQSVPACWDAWHETGPDYRAVLIPQGDGEVSVICGALGLMVFYNRGLGREFSPDIRAGSHHYNGGWHYWNPTKRLKLPEFVPDVAAGASGPVQLTEWKIKALRISAVIEVRGYVTRMDFRRYGLDHRRWTGPGGWLVDAGAPGQWKWREGAHGFRIAHPVVYPQVLAAVKAELEAMPPGMRDGVQRELRV